MNNWSVNLFKILCCPKKHSGAGILVVVAVLSTIVGFLSLGIVKLNQLSINSSEVSRVKLQAKQYAEAEANILKGTNYSDLVAKNKTVIANTNGFCSEIVLSAESNYSTNIKQRMATIRIYKNINDNNACYTLNVLKPNVELGASVSKVPVGTVIAWASSTAPSGGGDIWLLCNGQSCTAYPELKALVGNNVPNLNTIFLEGTTSTPGSTKSAGLPNIKGTLKSSDGARQFGDIEAGYYSCTGAFGIVMGSSWSIRNRSSDTLLIGFSFDASKSNSIYGASSTVQPASYLVRYYIKAN